MGWPTVTPLGRLFFDSPVDEWIVPEPSMDDGRVSEVSESLCGVRPAGRRALHQPFICTMKGRDGQKGTPWKL